MAGDHQSVYDSVMAPRAEGPNVRHTVPFFGVRDIDASLRFYEGGLGFVRMREWIPEGRVRWCWLELGSVALMLQEFWKDGRRGGGPSDPLGQGLSICFICADALAIYHGAIARGLTASTPFVGNQMWVTSLLDPDGYRLEFESPTDVREGTRYSNQTR
jgi:catechol 2,3-dioxygenase-like lactoylglutathione lyase family enzyme